VLRHRGQDYLLGVTPASVQLLDRWPADAPGEAPASPAVVAAPTRTPSGAP
jgi:hypothetical protein